MGEHVAVLGAGSWGTALAILLANNGHSVRLWARNPAVTKEINEERTNRHYLPGVTVPGRVIATPDLEWAVKETRVVVLVVPSHAVRATMGLLRPVIPPDAILVNTAKGLEVESLLRLSQVITEELPAEMHARVTVLSGPSHAEEVSRGLPTAVVVAAHRRQYAEIVQDLFMGPAFRVYTNPDMVGVELGGALKNVIALATGITDGLGLGDNTRAALMTRGLAEIARLGIEMGAKPLTFAGLAGVGDLIVTCGSMHSRNRRAGIELGKGKPLQQVLAGMGMVVEGVRTTQAAYRIAEKYGVEIPITQQVYRVLFEGQRAADGVPELMRRGPTHEVEGVVISQDGW